MICGPGGDLTGSLESRSQISLKSLSAERILQRRRDIKRFRRPLLVQKTPEDVPGPWMQGDRQRSVGWQPVGRPGQGHLLVTAGAVNSE